MNTQFSTHINCPGRSSSHVSIWYSTEIPVIRNVNERFDIHLKGLSQPSWETSIEKVSVGHGSTSDTYFIELKEIEVNPFKYDAFLQAMKEAGWTVNRFGYP